MLKGKLAKMNKEYKKFAKEAAKEIFKFDWDEFEKSGKGSDLRKANCQQIWKLFTYLNGAPANLRYGKAKDTVLLREYSRAFGGIFAGY